MFSCRLDFDWFLKQLKCEEVKHHRLDRVKRLSVRQRNLTGSYFPTFHGRVLSDRWSRGTKTVGTRLHFPSLCCRRTKPRYNLYRDLVCLQRRLHFRLRVVPLLLSPLSETRKEPTRKKWPREITPRISRGHSIFLAGFFRLSLDGQSGRGTTRSLATFPPL